MITVVSGGNSPAVSAEGKLYVFCSGTCVNGSFGFWFLQYLKMRDKVPFSSYGQDS